MVTSPASSNGSGHVSPLNPATPRERAPTGALRPLCEPGCPFVALPGHSLHPPVERARGRMLTPRRALVAVAAVVVYLSEVDERIQRTPAGEIALALGVYVLIGPARVHDGPSRAGRGLWRAARGVATTALALPPVATIGIVAGSAALLASRSRPR